MFIVSAAVMAALLFAILYAFGGGGGGYFANLTRETPLFVVRGRDTVHHLSTTTSSSTPPGQEEPTRPWPIAMIRNNPLLSSTQRPREQQVQAGLFTTTTTNLLTQENHLLTHPLDPHNLSKPFKCNSTTTAATAARIRPPGTSSTNYTSKLTAARSRLTFSKGRDTKNANTFSTTTFSTVATKSVKTPPVEGSSPYYPYSCLGPTSTSVLDFYFFVVETMFSIGYGSPRFPGCPIVSWSVTPIVLVGTLLHALAVGAVFAKFASGSRRRFLLRFSDQLCGHRKGSYKENNGELEEDEEEMRMIGEKNETILIREEEEEKKEAGGADDVVDDRKKVEREKMYGGKGEKQNRFNDTNVRMKIGKAKERTRSTRVLKTEEDDEMADEVIKSDGTLMNKEDLSINKQQEEFRLQFRVLNLTHQAFFNTKLNVYLLRHDEYGLSIFPFRDYTTDKPVEFLELPLLVTVHSRDIDPCSGFHFVDCWASFELLVLFHFTDTPTGRPVEIRHSWSLGSAVRWSWRFQEIISRLPTGELDVDVDAMSQMEPCYCFFCSPRWRQTKTAVQPGICI